MNARTCVLCGVPLAEPPLVPVLGQEIRKRDDGWLLKEEPKKPQKHPSASINTLAR
jgi:hypothetical protein